MNWKHLLFFAFLGQSLHLFSQKPADYEGLKEKYPKHDYVFLTDNKHVLMEVDGDSVNIKNTQFEQVYFTSDRANAFKNRSVTASFFMSLDEINAKSYYRKGNRYKKEKVKEFDTKKTISTDYFFDDLEKTTFEFPKLRNEGIAELETRKQYNIPFFSITAYFANFAPILQKEVTLEVDNEIDIAISYFNTDAEALNYTIDKKRNKTIHTWRLDSIDAVKKESGSPSPAYYLPHISVRIKRYTAENGDTVNVLRDVNDLYAWYESLISETKCENPEELISVLTEIIQPEDDELTKVRKVFNTVREKIKYIAIEDGLGGFIPRNPDLVYTRRYGDCKDMSALIVQMLELVDVKAHKTWIGTTDIPYSYEDMPTPAADNHMIAAWKNPKTGKFVYLDATDSFVPFGFPTHSIQGKEAMINLGDGNFTIEKVPAVPVNKNYWRDTSYLAINEDVLSGSGTLTFSGYVANTYNHALKNAHNDKRLKDHVKNNTLKGNNKYTLNEFSINKSDSLIKYDFNFDINDYIHTVNDELYVNLNLEKSFESFATDFEDREQAISVNYEKGYDLYYELSVPSGYITDYVPDNAEFDHPLFSYKITYDNSGNKVIYNLNLEKRYMMLEKEHFEDYTKMLKSLKNEMNQSVILKKNNK